ncbi:hypothetical protein L1987_82666 [Smallanthus sonchifolius]|uniref:Uncharacterized protein n=1 Tax=Smallanthus sonchifolius TaxID=185202 RepID=A0ACB8YBT3_9ASTR|nr:hypothetical protein L1987_82666 [Smallanthus sonchifolius]
MADSLCFSSSSSSSSSSYNFKNNTNFQLITSILLHDLSLLCSFIISYPLYFSYFVFFSRYFIKLISFISPLFIAVVFLSLLLTTTSTFCPNLPQLKLGILQTVIQKLKSNLYEVNGDEEDRNFEDFEIYKIVFDGTLSIVICNEDDEDMRLTKKILEHSVTGGSRNDVRTSYSDLEEIEKISENSVHGGRRNDASISDSNTDKSGIETNPENSVHGDRRNHASVSDSYTNNLVMETNPENSVHGGRRNDDSVSGSDTDKLGVEKTTENSVHGCRRNDDAISGSDTEKLGVEKTPEKSVHGGRRNDDSISDSDTEKLDVEKTPENSVYGGRRLTDFSVTDSYVDELEKEKGLEKLLEELERFEDFTTAIETDADSGKSCPVRRVCSGPADVNSSVDDKSQNSARSSSWRSNSLRIVNSHGSMREEKEWRRTLACKLFEERHNSRGGEEGMDSLWEAYENDNSKNRKEIMMNEKNNNYGGIESFIDEGSDDEDEDEEEMSNGHLCCLQALTLSTKKMNLGMGKSNFVKISKALKGLGWLHHVKNKHGKRS